MLQFHQTTLDEVCQAYHIQKLAIYGSALRADFRPDSDVDILVEFEAGHTPDFFKLYEIEERLSALFGGHAIDLTTFRAIHPHLRHALLAQAQVYYEK